MRTGIYYWKCDNPLPVEEKLLYNDKYQLADISPVVKEIFRRVYGCDPVEIENNGSGGNHYTYLVTLPDGKRYFLRADDGKGADDYMEAESAIMNEVRAAGIPCPHVHHQDTTLSIFPVRWQIMDIVDGRGLDHYHREGLLDVPKVGRQLGGYMARLHQLRYPGFGFVDTEHLRRTQGLRGLDATSADYFFKCLDRHLGFLVDHEFLSSAEAREIESLFDRHRALLDIGTGCLVHKDLAFWNIMGSPDNISAIVDWDDTILGDPADDIGILQCFHEGEVLDAVYEGYREVAPLPEPFVERTAIYMVRNLLWKAVIRTFMKYFDQSDQIFLHHQSHGGSLRHYTRNRLEQGIDILRSA
jgi:aminoglycoside phosphotransferase (APT) family kinase protein